MSKEAQGLINRESENIEIDLTWENLKCTVKSFDTTKQILKGISGYALHGEFLVLMGSSGAGKTTLLNILSRRLRKSSDIEVSGNIFVNTQPISEVKYSNYVGYVTQEDLLIPTMTVLETLIFVAKLKTSYPDKRKKVEELITELKLDKCKNTLIGNEYIKGVSGGERKRTSIGMEIITDPSILFLDEPTSGLDSYTALIVVELLRSKAKQGKTIISTIHQPNSEIFHLFDKLMLMADGLIVYHGKAEESVNFFDKCGYNCPVQSNPADYYMELLHLEDASKLTEKEQDLIQNLVTENKKIKEDPDLLKTKLDLEDVYKASFAKQTYLLTQRAFLRMLRNPMLLLMRVISILSIIIGTSIIFRNLDDPNDQSDFQAIASFIFNLLTTCTILNIFTTVLTFPTQSPIFEKEYQSNMYTVLPYVLSIVIVDVLYDLVMGVVLVSSIYWTVQLNTTSKAVIYFYFAVFFSLFTGSGIGAFVGSLFSIPELALVLSSGFILANVNFGGFLRGKNMPSGTTWLEYTSSFFYTFQAILRTQFEDKSFNGCTFCDPNSSTCPDCDPLDIYDVKVALATSAALVVAFAILYRIMSLLVCIIRASRLKSYDW
jgi:ABC-type multidrug transport system ATPase subunit